MALRQSIILRSVVRGIIPVMIVFGLYVQMHGKVSAGGGFQAGVILAAAFVLYSLVFGLQSLLEIIPFSYQKIGACLGVLVYLAVGFFGLLTSGSFLDYAPVGGQFTGILIVELGIGLTVASVMLILFCLFAERRKGE